MSHLATRRPETSERHQRELWDLSAGGGLTTAIHRRLALDDAAEAHRIMEDRANRGKVILEPAR